ncbi:MAG: serine--tRNA ligase, partial [Promethearchaeota archaeon]
MLDIELFRTNLDKIIKSEQKRFKDPKNAELVLEYDQKWRNVITELQKLRQKRNNISRQIGKLKKEGETEKIS